MSPGPIQIIIVVLLILLFFGRGRISDMMGDLGKGIKSFKNAVTEDDTKPSAQPDAPPRQIEAQTPPKTVEVPAEATPAPPVVETADPKAPATSDPSDGASR